MTKLLKNKIFIISSVIVVIAVAIIIAILLIGGTKGSPNDTPPVLPAVVSSEPTASTPAVSVPDIKVVATPSKAPSSEPVSEITVDGSPSSQVTSSKPESKVESKPTEQTKPTSSQPPKVESKEPSKDPNNPSQGTTKVVTNEFGNDIEMIFLDGQWWENGPANDKVVDDSDKTYPPCETCGQPSGHCTCRIGY